MIDVHLFLSPWRNARSLLPLQIRRTLYAALFLSAGLGFTSTSGAQPIWPGKDARPIAHSAPATWAQQAHSLRTMGIELQPLTAGPDGYKEIYFPVPADVPLDEAELTFKARYLMDEVGAQLQLLVDGQPMITRSFSAKEGLIDISLPLDPQTRQSGFVRLGINWLSTRILQACQVAPASASTLSISDETSISYRYTASPSFSLKSAWGAMSSNPLLLVSGEQGESAAFDAGWRFATVLQSAGKQVKVGAFPAVGDVVPMEGTEIPEALANNTVFESIGRAGPRLKIETEAVIGALMMLGVRPAIGDVVIVDDSMRKKMDSALDALEATLAQDPVATKALNAWRSKFSLAGDTTQPADMWVTFAGTHPIVAIRAQAGPQAAGLFSDTWRPILTSPHIQTTAAFPGSMESENRLHLSRLGASFGHFQVSNQGHWTTIFPLSAASTDGRMPTRLTLDVAVAPDSSSASPVVSVLLNGTLLTAARMRADGEQERISARIPGYALRLNNELRVEVQRKPEASGCAQPVKGYPVSVLPTSYLEVGKAQPDGTFVGLLPLLAGPLNLIVPDTWPDQAQHRIPEMARLAVASGMSPVHTRLVLAPGDKPAQPGATFVAMNVPVDGVQSKVNVAPSGKIAISKRHVTRLDVSGLEGITAVEVAKSGTQHGLLWQSGNEPTDVPGLSYVLDRGDVALIESGGRITWVDSTNPDSSSIADAADTAFYEWRHYLSWGIPLAAAVVSFFAVLLAVVYIARRRRVRKQKKA